MVLTSACVFTTTPGTCWASNRLVLVLRPLGFAPGAFLLKIPTYHYCLVTKQILSLTYETETKTRPSVLQYVRKAY
jgi:hypothetical protein